MPNARRNRRIRIGLIGAASMSLVAASAGGAMGWMIGGTSEAIKQYDRKNDALVPEGNTTKIVSEEDPTEPRPETSPTPLPANAWVPVNNAIQWATPVAPGQPLSGLSVRNGDQDVTIIAHLAARATTGAWIPVASMTVTSGKEAVLHPPAGDYSMTLVAAPVGMPFEQVASLAPTPATLFRMDPVANPNGPEPIRFSISKGVIRRMPSPGAAHTTLVAAAGRRAPRSSTRTMRPETARAEDVEDAVQETLKTPTPSDASVDTEQDSTG